MSFIEITLELQSDFMTPWQADTIFGHLAWSVLYEEGESALHDWLAQFAACDEARFRGDRRTTPPLLLSDGFVSGWLPRPMLPPRSERMLSASVQDALEEAAQAKQRKGMRWLAAEAFGTVQYESERHMSKNGDFRARVGMHNVIDRLNQTSLSVNGLYTQLQWAHECKVTDPETTQPILVSLFAATSSEAERKRLLYHLKQMALTGYGKRKNIGMGQFRLVDYRGPNDEWYEWRDRQAWFTEMSQDANAEMWLSHGVPAPLDSVNGSYRLATKYGKLGEGWRGTGSPFKRPLTRIVPGSVFVLEDAYTGCAGRMVSGISDQSDVIVQYGYALTIPIRLEVNQLETMVACDTRRF